MLGRTMKALFQNPKAALAYVGITIVSVAMFIGTEDSPGSLHKTLSTFNGGKSASDIAAERRFGDPPPDREPAAKEPAEQVVVEFIPDEELVNDASGFDPDPVDDFSGFDPSPDSERPLLSEQDKKKPADDFGGWGSDTED